MVVPARAPAPGKGWYVLAGAAALAGFLAAAALVASLVLHYDGGTQFVAPGSKTLDLRKGRQVIWNDHVTVFEGRSYDSSRNLPDGLQITVTDGSGRSVTLRGTTGATVKGGGTERVAVMDFEVLQPGRYTITARGDFPPRVLSVGPEVVWLVMGSIFGAIGLVLLGTGAGVAIAAWAFIRREQAREAAAGVAKAPVVADAREASLRRLSTIIYALQVVSFVIPFTMIVGVIINYVQRDEVAGTWLESHFRWQIRTFWYSLLWVGVGLATLIVVIGFFVLMGSALWLLYRAIKGWLSLEEGKAMYAS